MKTILLGVGMLFTLSATAQSVVGTWKRTATVIAYKNGRTADVQPMMAKSIPCTVKITYEFLANGTQKTNIPADCKQALSAMADMYVDTRYVVKGNQVTIISPNTQKFPDATYALTVSGNTMTWLIDYDTQPGIPNPGKAKTLTITYQRE